MFAIKWENFKLILDNYRDKKLKTIMITFDLKDGEDYIELISLLKVLSLVSSGGEGKIRINDGEAIVNGVVDTRKRKKLRSGDKIEFDGNEILIG